MIRLNHQSRSKSSRKHHINIWAVIESETSSLKSEIRSSIINTRNIILARVFFEYSIYFLSEAIVLSHQLDSLSIRSENRSILYFWSSYQWNLFSLHRHWNHSICSRLDSKTYLLIIANRSLSLATVIASLFESENQSISQHISVQYFDKNSVLRSFIFFENIAKSYLFRLQKTLFLLSQSWTQYHLVRNDKNLLAKTSHQHLILNLFTVHENLSKFHSFI